MHDEVRLRMYGCWASIVCFYASECEFTDPVHPCTNRHAYNVTVSVSHVWFLYPWVICPALFRCSPKTQPAFPYTCPSCMSYSPSFLPASWWERLNSSTLNIFLLQCSDRILGIWVWGGMWAVCSSLKRDTRRTWHPDQNIPEALWVGCPVSFEAWCAC